MRSRIATWQNMLSLDVTIKLHLETHVRACEDAVTSKTTPKPSDCAFARLRNLTFNYTEIRTSSFSFPSFYRRASTSLGKQCGTVVIGYLPDPVMRKLRVLGEGTGGARHELLHAVSRAASSSVRQIKTFITIVSPETPVKCHSQLRCTETHYRLRL